MDIVILAAGRGKRFGKITKDLPKPLVNVNGKPIIEHILEKISKGNRINIYFIVGYKKEKIIEFIESVKDKYLFNPLYVYQEKLLGTGHAVSLLPDNISNQFLLLVGDHIYSNIPNVDIPDIENSDSIIYYTQKSEDNLNKGVFKVKNGKVKEFFYNKEKINEKVPIDVNIIVLPKKTIDYAKNINYKNEEVYLADIINKMIKNNENIELREYCGEIKHITNPEDVH